VNRMIKKLFPSVVLFLFVAAMLSACGGGGGTSPDGGNATSSGSEKTVSFSMGLQPWVGYAPWWIAAEQGIFDKYGLDVKIVNFIQDADINAAFASDNIKVANLATHTAIKLVGTNKLDLLGISLLDVSMEADAVIARGDIKSISDLKGKKVAFEEGTTSDLLIRKALIENHMSINDIQVVYMPASDAGLALLSGNVDAAVTYEPYISNVKAKGEVNMIYSGREAPGLISDMAFIKSKFLEENPDIIDKLRKVWDETLEFWKNNKEAGDKIIADNVGIDVSELQIILDGLKYYDSAEQAKVADSEDFLNTVKNIQQILIDQKMLDGEIDLNRLLHLK